MSAVTVIKLWPRPATCRRCDVETFDRFCWPYYETFLPSTTTREDLCYVTVCASCYRKLDRLDDLLIVREATP